MAQSENLIGDRIRTRRLAAGLKQQELAQTVGISSSYLNLIEHNRRQIGGKLLLELAAALGVDAAVLREGASPRVLARLEEAAREAKLSDAQRATRHEFVDRFPDWASILVSSQDRIDALEAHVKRLQDRLAHDPDWSNAVHELLTATASIRSTASIMAQSESIDPKWQAQFTQNIDRESRRLAARSKELTELLAQDSAVLRLADDPMTQLARENYYAQELEDGRTVQEVLTSFLAQAGAQARSVAEPILKRVSQDCEEISAKALQMHLANGIVDPAELAEQSASTIDTALRRIGLCGAADASLVEVDRSGAFLLTKTGGRFVLPSSPPACPVWPLFEAFSMPGQLIARPVIQLSRAEIGAEKTPLMGFAFARPRRISAANHPADLVSTMLLVPLKMVAEPLKNLPPMDIGVTCSLCAKPDCVQRRTPSILVSQAGAF